MCEEFLLAVKLNDMGVKQIQQMEYITAIDLFRESLDTLKLVIRKASERGINIEKFNAENDENRNSSTFESTRKRILLRDEIAIEDHDEQQKSIFFAAPLTNDPFIYPYPKELKFCSFPRLNAASAAVLYNLALAHHMLGDVGGSQYFFQNALVLYELTIEVTKEMLIGKNCIEKEDILLFHAALNNLGQIHYNFGRYSSARSIFRELSMANAQDEFAVNAEIISGHENSPAA